ncbi:MAG TPA: glycosyltransferase family 39 protein [Magnetospirillum sp.]|jgi:4-amino-4-deoxy-L-arabinose transferase-like glycosyltransferase|nr:glycosyltransferase family 39 protein [Magnetospirillum sp.]
MSELGLNSRRATGLALGLIAAIALLRAGLLAFAAPNLSFDEAQYWAWAQHIQLGYYSKPPMVAWAIAATTALFGEGSGAVKLGSMLAQTGTALLVLLLGRALFGRTIGAWAGVAWMTMPAVSLSSLMITTDPFLLFFWAAALLAVVEAPRKGPGFNRWWMAFGVALGLGLLSKYAMVFFLGCLFLWLAWDREARPLARMPGLWLGIGLGVLIYLPNLAWNAANGFVSYVHTKDNANLKGSLFNPDKLAEFVVGQFGVFGPILMVALVLALVAACRKGAPSRVKMLTAFTLPVLAVMTVESFLSRANANWTAPAFVTATLLATWWLAEKKPALLKVSLALHLAIMGGMYSLDGARRVVDFSFDPEKRIKGWETVGDRVSAVLAAHPGARLLADERKVMATLIYYVHPHPFDAVKWNPGGQIHDHYDQTTRLEPGQETWIYVTERDDLDDAIGSRFTTVEKLEDVVVPLHHAHARHVVIWRLTGFKGY